MKPIRREIPQLPQLQQLIEAVSGQPPEVALQLFLNSLPLTDFITQKANTESLIEKYPLAHQFPHVQYARDGRTVARSSAEIEDKVYGMPSHLWRAMVRECGPRIALYVTRFLAPAWITLSAEHPLNLADFTFLAKESPLVPSGRESLVARGLHYGYGGDFTTAAQLLVPQLEHIVRVKLADAGVGTSTSEDGIETEKGLSALMKTEDADRVFGPNISFEIRSLFCSTHGPNLRNEFAHGLVDDTHINSASAFYAWWLIWRLVCSSFFNTERDAAASDREAPTAPQGVD